MFDHEIQPTDGNQPVTGKVEIMKSLDFSAYESLIAGIDSAITAFSDGLDIGDIKTAHHAGVMNICMADLETVRHNIFVAFQPPSSDEDLKKARRRVEDCLRKSNRMVQHIAPFVLR